MISHSASRCIYKYVQSITDKKNSILRNIMNSDIGIPDRIWFWNFTQLYTKNQRGTM